MFKSIVIPFDTEARESWSAILPTALSIVENYRPKITLCTVIPELAPMMDADWLEAGSKQMTELAHEQFAILLREQPGLAGARIEIAKGSIWRGIVAIAAHADADLIVLASHRPAMKDYLIGANAVNVVRHAPCPVMFVRSPALDNLEVTQASVES